MTSSKIETPDSVALVVLPRTGDIGGFEVKRALPSQGKRMVGPFVFWDQMGPGTFGAGQGLDVRPHPHIGLSTVTYLFRGSMAHKDSLGNDLVIQPGQVNLMTAGKGIVHSERSDPDSRAVPSELYGIQSWLALPKDQAECDPAFDHYPASDIPKKAEKGVSITQIMGSAFGLTSPVKMAHPTLYAETLLEKDAWLELAPDYAERALYIVEGEIEIDGTVFGESQLVVLKEGESITYTAISDAHVMVLGGDTMDGPRLLWWNYVGTSKDRIRQAAIDWEAGRFPTVPSDDEEFIPLPDLGPLEAMKDL